MEPVIQWLNANQYRSYPLAEDADLTGSGGFVLPKGALIELRGVAYDRAAQDVVLKSVAIAGGQVIFTFEYVTDAVTFTFGVPDTLTGTLELSVGSNVTHRVTAVFGPGVAKLAAAYPAATYTMTDPPIIEPTCLTFQDIHRVNSIQALGGADTEVLQGDIYCEEGNNCSILVSQVPSRVIVRAIKGAGAGDICDPADADALTCDDVLLRINGLQAGEEGGFMLVGGAGVEVIPDPDNNQIIIRARGGTESVLCEE